MGARTLSHPKWERGRISARALLSLFFCRELGAVLDLFSFETCSDFLPVFFPLVVTSWRVFVLSRV